MKQNKKLPLSNIVEDYNSSSPQEVWIDGVLYNFIYGFLAAVIIVAVNSRMDMAVLISYMVYYFFLGKIGSRSSSTSSRKGCTGSELDSPR